MVAGFWAVGGWLRSMGVIDFAGGLVVHTAAAALAGAVVIGRRKGLEKENGMRPNNMPYVILGASILWFGWFRFNAGSSLAANALPVNALVVTNLAAAAAAVSWMMVDWTRKGKPSAVGISVGAVCGLVAILCANARSWSLAPMRVDRFHSPMTRMQSLNGSVTGLLKFPSSDDPESDDVEPSSGNSIHC